MSILQPKQEQRFLYELEVERNPGRFKKYYYQSKDAFNIYGKRKIDQLHRMNVNTSYTVTKLRVLEEEKI